MDREYVKIDRSTYDAISRRAAKKGGLCQALWGRASSYYGNDSFSTLWEELTRVIGAAPNTLTRMEEFWVPELKKAVNYLVDDDRFADDMMDMTRMCMEGQFSGSMWRRNYRSSDFGYYASWIASRISGCIYLRSYSRSAKELLFMQNDWLRCYDVTLALELRRGNREIIDLIREAMLGDNQQILLSTPIIRAVIISGNQELIDVLIRLLLAAQLQEGLRQQILENADAGSRDTLIRILKVCLDEDLFRFSSATRAFDTWTGLGYGDAKPAVVKKCAAFAYECLTDETVRKQYLTSENNLEAFFALWAAGCYEAADTDQMVRALLDDEKKYRRILGWYFISHMDNDRYQMGLAGDYIAERDEEVLAWAAANLAVTTKLLSSYTYNKKEWVREPVPNSCFPADASKRRELFFKLKDAAEFIGGRKHTFTGNPFAFASVTLENTRIISCMMGVAGYDMDEELIDELAKLLPVMDVEQRRAFYINFLIPETNAVHRAYVRQALEDRSIHVKELAVTRLEKCQLLEEDLEALADSLRSKSSSLRKAVLSIFHTALSQKQNQSRISSVIAKMLVSPEEYQVQAGIELLLDIRDTASELLEVHKARLEEMRGAAEISAAEKSAAGKPSAGKTTTERPAYSTQTMILLEQLLESGNQDAESFTEENGFGLYDPVAVAQEAEGDSLAAQNTSGSTQQSKAEKTGLLSRLKQTLFADKAPSNDPNAQPTPATGNTPLPPYTDRDLKKMLPTRQQYLAVVDAMNQVFERHKNYEYETENWDGSRRKVLFGDPGAGGNLPIPAEHATWKEVYRGKKFEWIPFHTEFQEALSEYAAEPEKLLGLCSVAMRYSGDHIWGGTEKQSWFAALENKVSVENYGDEAFRKFDRRYWQILDILALLPQCVEEKKRFTVSIRAYRATIQMVGEENLARNYLQESKDKRYSYMSRLTAYPINHKMFAFWRTMLRQAVTDPEDFAEWFRLEHRLERMLKVNINTGLDMEDYFRACDMGLISREALTERLLLGCTAEGDIRALTHPMKGNRGKNLFDKYPWAESFVRRIVCRIVEVEGKRGELATPLTGVARNIGRFEGAQYFCSLLAALGRENFFRGYEYSSDTTKRAVLSRLLKRCYPAEGDTPEKLRELLQKTDIKEKRMAEAVMYAPQWASFAEEILGWPGLKCAVWFFHAHVNESFSAEKETEVALYSPISPQQFNDGAFDPDWFREAYEKLGEKRFQILYKSAKYITAGSNQHRRSQLYADAALGKLDAEELKKEIIEKRNQEKLRCYPLIPIRDGQSEEALRRYEFIQKFLKESKQFGSQRRESEKKACATAMENLAITTGFRDVNRMTWYLESAKMDEIRPMLEPVRIGDVSVRLVIGEDGTAELAAAKISADGKEKELKTLPKNLNKDETVLAIKETAKELKEQKRRARESLERAMMDSTEFGCSEIERICANPVLAPMLKALVWNCDGHNGFVDIAVENGGEQGLQGTSAGQNGSEGQKSAADGQITHLRLRSANGTTYPRRPTPTSAWPIPTT